MKKILKVFIIATCLIVMSMALAACSLFGAPSVKGCTYQYDKTDCDMSGLNASDRMVINNQLNACRSSISTLAFSEDGTVEITSFSGKETIYEYSQLGTDILIPGGPNKNTTFEHDIVLGLTITRDSKEVLKWHTQLFLDNGTTIEINIYYNIVPAADDTVE